MLFNFYTLSTPLWFEVSTFWKMHIFLYKNKMHTFGEVPHSLRCMDEEKIIC